MNRGLCLRESMEYPGQYEISLKGDVSECYCMTCEYLRSRKIVKIAVVGSRNFSDYKFFSERVSHLIQNITEEIVFISGGCKTGADKLIKGYCRDGGFKLIEHLPEYKKFENKKAAPIARNKTIVDDSDMMIAFWDYVSRGTKSAIDFAQKKNIPIRIVKIQKKPEMKMLTYR